MQETLSNLETIKEELDLEKKKLFDLENQASEEKIEEEIQRWADLAENYARNAQNRLELDIPVHLGLIEKTRKIVGNFIPHPKFKDPLELITSELIADEFGYAHNLDHGEVKNHNLKESTKLILEKNPNQFVLELKDKGEGPPLSKEIDLEIPDAEKESGRGLFLTKNAIDALNAKVDLETFIDQKTQVVSHDLKIKIPLK